MNYNFFEFERYVIGHYFPLKVYKDIPEKVTQFYENRASRFVDIKFNQKEAVLNIMELNIKEFEKKAKKKFKFLEANRENYKVYLFEYTKPYYKSWINNHYDYAGAELITDLYIYNIKEDKVVAYLESREGLTTFESYFKNSFIGFIHTEDEYRRQEMATFMIKVMPFYLWIKRRKYLYSGTSLPEYSKALFSSLSKRTKWVQRDDYNNIHTDKPQERYILKPIKLNIKLNDGGVELVF